MNSSSPFWFFVHIFRAIPLAVMIGGLLTLLSWIVGGGVGKAVTHAVSVVWNLRIAIARWRVKRSGTGPGDIAQRLGRELATTQAQLADFEKELSRKRGQKTFRVYLLGLLIAPLRARSAIRAIEADEFRKLLVDFYSFAERAQDTDYRRLGAAYSAWLRPDPDL